MQIINFTHRKVSFLKVFPRLDVEPSNVNEKEKIELKNKPGVVVIMDRDDAAQAVEDGWLNVIVIDDGWACDPYEERDNDYELK